MNGLENPQYSGVEREVRALSGVYTMLLSEPEDRGRHQVEIGNCYHCCNQIDEFIHVPSLFREINFGTDL